MRREDRILAWAAVIVFAVIAVALLWIIFIGPADHVAQQATKQETKELLLGLSPDAWTAIFSGLLAVSTIFAIDIARRQMVISGQQTDILEKQKDIQRQEFLVTHRPRMRVRFVHGPEPTDDSTWEFRVYLANVGDSTATVKSFTFAAFAIDGDDETFIEVVPAEKGIEPIEVGAGVMMRGTAKDWTSFDSVFTGQILVTGRIVYEDSVGASRITAFAREKTGLDGRFRVADKYAVDEYED